jgi:hypothetical protein
LDNKTIYAACCFKMALLVDQLKLPRRSRPTKKFTITWEKVRTIRSLYGMPTPGKLYANGAPMLHTYTSLERLTKIPDHVVMKIVNNQVCVE